MRKPHHKFANRQRKLQAKSRKQIARRERDDDTFYDDDLLFFAIDQALKNPEVNMIMAENGENAVILRGPNAKGKTVLKMICARATQLEAITKKYNHYVVERAELDGRFARLEGYGLDSFKRISFSSKEEWERAWSTSEHDFHLSEGQYDLYNTKEVWANDEYWAVLDKQCEIGTHTSFLGYPLWHLAIRRRNEKPLRDWRILQGIKNKVVGEGFEAVELYPADSRIMDVGNVYHLWVLAPKQGETEPPRFPVGAKNPEQGGLITHGVIPVLLCTERTKRAFDNGEMPLKDKKGFVGMAGKVDMLIFPDVLMPDVEREFPGEEPLNAVYKYVHHHPEVELQKWEPAL